MRSRLWLKATLLTLVLIGYPAAMHQLLTSGQWPATTLCVGLLPLAMLPLGLLQAGHPVWSGLCALAGLALAGLFWNTLLQTQDWLYLMQNAGMQSLLAWVFGRTLRPAHEPLISQFARRIHGADYSPAIARYTRQATWAWTLFFVAMMLISVVLFVVASLGTWSFFINVLSLPLLGLMFVLEYAARRYRLRDVPHVPFLTSVSLYWENSAAADGKS